METIFFKVDDYILHIICWWPRVDLSKLIGDKVLTARAPFCSHFRANMKDVDRFSRMTEGWKAKNLFFLIKCCNINSVKPLKNYVFLIVRNTVKNLNTLPR